jgi:hypothetical protein
MRGGKKVADILKARWEAGAREKCRAERIEGDTVTGQRHGAARGDRVEGRERARWGRLGVESLLTAPWISSERAEIQWTGYYRKLRSLSLSPSLSLEPGGDTVVFGAMPVW